MRNHGFDIYLVNVKTVRTIAQIFVAFSEKLNFKKFVKSMCSDAASGWAGWALAHLEFGVSVNPIPTRGAEYAHRITACPPGFENLAASLICHTYVY